MEQKITIKINTEPLSTFIKLVDGVVQVVDRGIKLPHFCPELARIEMDVCPTSAHEIVVTFYPSDSFLRFLSALWASNSNLAIVKNPTHKRPPANYWAP